MEVQLIEVMASDLAVVQAARVSTAGSDSLTTESNDGLIKYLMRERHASPFEHNVFKFFVRAPIFVAREFMRHRIASYNEESGRYRQLKGDFYFVPAERPLEQIGKTGNYHFKDEPNPELLALVNECFHESYDTSWAMYLEMLENGVAKEVARMVLPVGIYSSWYVTINARSLMNFLSLRTASNAQWEIQQIALKMEDSFSLHMPVTYAAWVENGRKSI
jgi:thymidylate synthase (FAD)